MQSHLTIIIPTPNSLCNINILSKSLVLNKKVYSEDRCSLEFKVHEELHYCRGHGEWFQINVKNAIDKIKELS